MIRTLHGVVASVKGGLVIGDQDLDDVVYTGNNLLISGTDASSSGTLWDADGGRFFNFGFASNQIHTYGCPTNWSVVGASFTGDSKGFAEISTLSAAWWKPDGTKLYVLDSSTSFVYQYSASIAYNILTLTYDSKSFSFGTATLQTNGITFNPDGTIMYLTRQFHTDLVLQYALSVAWDVSTAVYDNKLFAYAQDTNPSKTVFKLDGSRMYMVGFGSDTVYQYDLSTNWDVDTAVYNSVSFPLSGQSITAPTGLFFKPEGDKMFVSGNTSDRIYEYTL